MQVIGRDAELEALDGFVRGLPQALLLRGDPGMGKTTLWEACAATARARGVRVVAARPSETETRLGYSALGDLLHDVDSTTLDDLPPPQRHALGVALLREEPRGRRPAPQAVYLGFLNLLRRLAGSDAVLVAIDDAPWLDAPSAEALVFAARRLDREAVGFLLAARRGGVTPLEAALEPRGLRRLDVAPLSLGATRRLLAERLSLTLSRHTLRRVYEASGGNPLFALELGRSLAERGALGRDEELPLPERLEDLLGAQVEGLPQPVRRLLLACALAGAPRASHLVRILDRTALEAGLEARVVVADGERVRASHPLLAAVARERAVPGERHALHRALAEVADDPEVAARHLALASVDVDEGLAAKVAEASRAAAARGAVQDAAALAEHALRLTPAETPQRLDRLFTLAERLDLAGEPQRVTELLTPQLPSLPSGRARARAHLLLSEGAVSNMLETLEHLDHALAEGAGAPEIHAVALAKKATICASTRVERIPEAEAWALEALAEAELVGAEQGRLALTALAWARSLQGLPVDDLAERFRTASSAAYHMVDSVDRIVGARHSWRGEVAAARELIRGMLDVADARDEPWSSAVLRSDLCGIAMRAGAWAEAAAMLADWLESPESELLAGGPFHDRIRAHLAVGVGRPAEAEELATRALRRSEAAGEGWSKLIALRALGGAALLAREPARAAESLWQVWEHTRQAGVADPGAHPVAADLVEALLELGDVRRATEVAELLQAQAERQEHPWGLVTARRCHALIGLLAEGDGRQVADLAEAAVGYEGLGLRHDRARVLLALGRAERRLRRWKAARESLELAAAAFDELGATGWAEAARSELGRVSARRPRPEGELTEAERRAAELAADGLSNKEIAATLVVTVHTVEVHLSRAYAKLGVRSRSQLAHALGSKD